MDNVTAGLYRPQPFLSTVKYAWNAFLSSQNGLCQVDSLTAPPTNAPSVKRQDRALCAEKTKQLTAHGPGSTVCTARCAKAPSRRTGLGGRPRLANVARARESGLQGYAETLHDADCCRTCRNIPDLMLKCPNTHERAQLRLGSRYASSHPGDIWGWEAHTAHRGENRNQTIKCRTKIKQSNTSCNTTIPYHPEKESKQSKYR